MMHPGSLPAPWLPACTPDPCLHPGSLRQYLNHRSLGKPLSPPLLSPHPGQRGYVAPQDPNSSTVLAAARSAPVLLPCHLSIPRASCPGWAHRGSMGNFWALVHPSLLLRWVQAAGPGGLRQPAEHRGRGIWAMPTRWPPQSGQGRQLIQGLTLGRLHEGGRAGQHQNPAGQPARLHRGRHYQHWAPPQLAGLRLWMGWPQCRACGRAVGREPAVPHIPQLLVCL